MKNANTRHKRLPAFFLILFSLAFFASTVQARDVTFTWTANAEMVDGYRLYYKTGTSGGSPYDGTGVTEGNSPVDMGNVTTFTLHNLSDSETYYFVLTALAGTLESDYSSELTLEPIPEPSPTGATATFSWQPNQEANLAGYKIHYGTTSGSYDTTTDAGKPTLVDGRIQTQVDNLTEGTTYYFAATAYDTNGVKSDYSTEIVWTATSGSGSGNPPIATDNEVNTSEDQSVSGTVTAGNDTGLPISYLVQQNVSKGTLLLETGTGNFTYTPQADIAGSDSFTFLARDDNGDSNIATVSITITATNDPPTAENAVLTVNEDSTANGQLHAQDPDADDLIYAVVANPNRGTLTVNAGGAITYTPAVDATGADSFTFQVSDGQATSNTATVSITITAINDPPTAENAALTVNEDSAANGQLHAQDPDGDDLTYTVVANPTSGTLTVNAGGAFTYTPAVDATGANSFTYQVSDGQATSNTATVSIIISPVNDAPVAQDGSLNAFTGQSTSGTLQASDRDNDVLTYSLASDPQQVVTIANPVTGAYTFHPVDGMTSPYTFTFTTNDGTVASNTATITVTLLEAGATTEIFGDTPDSTHPGTLADTYTNVNNDINASAEQISTWSWSSPTPHKPANTIIIKTDLSALPNNIQITEAKFYLYQTSAYGEATYNNNIHKITGKTPIIEQVTGYNAYNGEPWTPVAAGTTYTDIPLGLTDIDQAEDTITLDTQPGYRTWLITNMVQDWINDSAENFGLLISGIPTTIQTGRTFAASENQNESIRPKLVIRYIKKPPKPNIISAKKIE